MPPRATKRHWVPFLLNEKINEQLYNEVEYRVESVIVLYLPYGVSNSGVRVLSKLGDFRENISQKRQEKKLITSSSSSSSAVPVELLLGVVFVCLFVCFQIEV